MKICVLIPSEDHINQAGVRIRYRRIEASLRDLGHELHLIPIQKVTTHHDAYIISKCYDVRALVFARMLAGTKPVGVDLFDDYFSQRHDSRLAMLRLWLNTLLKSADFILCSTPAMRELAESLAPRLPVHVMNDPYPRLDSSAICAAIRSKLDHVHKTKTLNVAWFGMGDNLHFPVGLSDLASFGGELARLRGRGLDVRLEILTNRRAMTANRLTMLRRLAVPYTVEEWSEERETALLGRSLACFLPVNAQNFSIVKSLNRAVTALCAGVQVLTSGYPLYEPLAPFIYRDPLRLLKDIEGRSLALREDTVPKFVRLMEQWAAPAHQARTLAEFLERRCESKPHTSTAQPRQPFAAVIHGKDTIGDVHKFAQRMDALSVASPFCSQNLNFDLRFSFHADGRHMEAYIAEEYCPIVEPGVQPLLYSHGRIGDRNYRKLELRRLLPDCTFGGTALAGLNTPMGFIASYAHVMAIVTEAVEMLFPGTTCYYSEHSRMPWGVLPCRQFRPREVA